MNEPKTFGNDFYFQVFRRFGGIAINMHGRGIIVFNKKLFCLKIDDREFQRGFHFLQFPRKNLFYEVVQQKRLCGFFYDHHVEQSYRPEPYEDARYYEPSDQGEEGRGWRPGATSFPASAWS